MTSDSKTELQQKLDALIDEKRSIQSRITAMEEDLPKLKKRLSDLLGTYFGGSGEIALATADVRDSQFPILDSDQWGARRIVELDDKWIHTRVDRRAETVRYRRADGARDRSRAGASWWRIDVAKAVEIWSQHLKDKEQAASSSAETKPQQTSLP